MSKRILVLGVNGQDGSYLSELLLERGDDVYGVIRRSSSPNTARIDHIFNANNRDKIFYGDLIEGIHNLIYEIKPDIIFNLAAQSHVWVSFKQPVFTGEVNAIGVIKILEAIVQAQKVLNKEIRFYQASSSELWGITPPPQNEESLMQPQSPYGVAKLYAYWITKCYRNSYGLFAANGILHNHESPRRGINFVTRKITRAASRILLGLQKNIELGNLDAQRDWGHAEDYMKCVIKIMDYPSPSDFVVATGEMHTVREFAEKVFKYFNLDFYDYLIENDILKRPSEVPALCGNAQKAHLLLGWKPEYTFDMLIKEMCNHDFDEAKKELK